MLRDALLHGRSCNIFYLPVLLKIDLFAIGPSPYDEIEFSRKRSQVVRAGESLVLKTPEDSVLRKLLWFREGGGVSDKQWRDVLEVLRVSETDSTYLDVWAARLGLAPLLAKARAER